MVRHLTFALGLLVAIATSTTLRAQEYVFGSYGQANGLKNLSVRALALDLHGFFWIGTENGLFRFLGSDFQRFGPDAGIPEGSIEDILAAPDGSVWVGTLGNLYRWTGNGFSQPVPRPISFNGASRMAAVSPGNLLVIIDSSLYGLSYGSATGPVSYRRIFSGADTASHPHLEELRTVAVSADRTVWMGCGSQLCEWRDGVVAEWGPREGVPAESCYSIQFGHDGSVWVETTDHVLQLPHAGGRFIDRTPSKGDSRGFFQRLPLAVDPQGRILSSVEDGVARWDGSAWTRIGPQNGLRSSHITAMAFDWTGDLWMGSTGHGLHHWVGYGKWEGWSERQGFPSSNIWSVGLFDRRYRYFGTEKGPVSIDLASGSVRRLFRSDARWPYGQVTGMALEPAGDLLVASKSGAILRIAHDTLKVTKIAAVPGPVDNLVLETSGRILVPASSGILEIDPASPRDRKPTAQRLMAEPIPAPVLNSCVSPDGTAWFVTRKAVLRFAQGRWSRHLVPGAGHAEALLNNLSCAPDGSVWIVGRQPEIWHLAARNGRWQAVLFPIPLAGSYGSLAVLAVVQDRRGWLWVGTDDGLLAWNGSTWRHLTQETGLIWNDVNAGRMAEGQDGSIWIGTSGGLGHILRPESVFDNSPLAISMIEVRRGADTVDVNGPLTFPWSDQPMRFQFAAPNALNRSDLGFHYRIPQLGPLWTETKDPSAHVTSLHPGKYTFEAFAKNPSLNSESPLVTLNFQILAPWWRTPWFRALCGAAALVLIGFGHSIRTRRLLRQQRRLEELILERTRELEASREELRHQATHDGLTGLMNRVAILAALDQAIERGAQDGSEIIVMLADIDYFKQVNDTYGHPAGDAGLKRFAEVLSGSIRTCDRAGRYGGEEFLMVLTSDSAARAQDLALDLHGHISNLKVRCASVEFPITVSLGAVSIYPAHGGIEPQRVLAAADEALYQAKTSGRNRVFYRPFVDPVEENSVPGYQVSVPLH